MAQLSWQLWSSCYNLRSLWLPTTWTYLGETACPWSWEGVFNFCKIICPIEHKGSNFRNSRLEVFCKKGVRKIHRKTPVPESQARPATLLKKSLWHRCFPVNFVKFLRTLFFTEHLWWLPTRFVEKKLTFAILLTTIP